MYNLTCSTFLSILHNLNYEPTLYPNTYTEHIIDILRIIHTESDLQICLAEVVDVLRKHDGKFSGQISTTQPRLCSPLCMAKGF